MRMADCTNYELAEQYLDEKFGKDWHWNVDLDKLDQSRYTRCIIGQLAGRGEAPTSWKYGGVFGSPSDVVTKGLPHPTDKFYEIIVRRREKECADKRIPDSIPVRLSEGWSMFVKKRPTIVEFEDGWRANYNSLSEIPVGVKYKVIV